jgi:hypothetical protein
MSVQYQLQSPSGQKRDQLGECPPPIMVPHHTFNSQSIDFNGKFEISEHGLFTIRRKGPDVGDLDKSETNSTRAEIDSVPDVKSLPLDEPWTDDRTGSSTDDVALDPTDPSNILLGTGGWNNIPDKDMEFLVPGAWSLWVWMTCRIWTWTYRLPSLRCPPSQ